MDTTNSRGLTQMERTELQSKIQRLQWLLRECIGLEEYELCAQIKAVIQRKHTILNENPKELT